MKNPLFLPLLVIGAAKSLRSEICNTNEDEHWTLIERNIPHSHCITLLFKNSSSNGCTMTSFVYGFSNTSEDQCTISHERITCYCARNCPEGDAESIQSVMFSTMASKDSFWDQRKCLIEVLASWRERRSLRLERIFGAVSHANSSDPVGANITRTTSNTRISFTNETAITTTSTALTTTVIPTTTSTTTVTMPSSSTTTTEPTTSTSTTSTPTTTTTTSTPTTTTTTSTPTITTTTTTPTTTTTTTSTTTTTTTTPTTTTTTTPTTTTTTTPTTTTTITTTTTPTTTTTTTPTTTTTTTTTTIPTTTTTTTTTTTPTTTTTTPTTTTPTTTSTTTTTTTPTTTTTTTPTTTTTTTTTSTTTTTTPATTSTTSTTTTTTTPTMTTTTSTKTTVSTTTITAPSSKTISSATLSPSVTTTTALHTGLAYSERTSTTEQVTSAGHNVSHAEDKAYHGALKALMMRTYMKLFFLFAAISLIMIAQLTFIGCIRNRLKKDMESDSESPPPLQRSKRKTSNASPEQGGAVKRIRRFFEGFRKYLQAPEEQLEDKPMVSLTKEPTSSTITNPSAEPTDETTGTTAMYAARSEWRPVTEGSAETVATTGSQEATETYPEPEPSYYRYPRRRPPEKKYVKGWEWM